MRAPFHDGARQFKAREKNLKKKLRKFIVKKRITSQKWRTKTQGIAGSGNPLNSRCGSTLVRNMESLVDNENDETAREPKSKIKLVLL